MGGGGAVVPARLSLPCLGRRQRLAITRARAILPSFCIVMPRGGVVLSGRHADMDETVVRAYLTV
jgi:hypothetical protein